MDKPAGLTSHQVVARVRRSLGTRKVGHAGTLDPMATGVLIVGVERGTRLLGQLSLTAKAYRATIRLGVGTLTDDAEGEVTDRPGAVDVDSAGLDAAVAALRGPIQQVPTAVSAIKVAGVRAYAKVRAGEQVELAARSVTVHRFDVIGRRETLADVTPVVDLDVAVECSSGTYVRALARDLGRSLKTGGHLTSLRRTRVGPFAADEAVGLDDVAQATMLSLSEVAHRCFPGRTLTAEQAADVGYGRRLAEVELTELTAVFAPDDTFLALYRPDGGGARAEAVFVG